MWTSSLEILIKPILVLNLSTVKDYLAISVPKVILVVSLPIRSYFLRWRAEIH